MYKHTRCTYLETTQYIIRLQPQNLLPGLYWFTLALETTSHIRTPVPSSTFVRSLLVYPALPKKDFHFMYLLFIYLVLLGVCREKKTIISTVTSS